MPLRYRIENGIVFVDVSETYTIQENYEFTKTWFTDPDRPSPILLCRNSTALDGSQTWDDMQMLAGLYDQVREENEIPAGSRMAVVALNDLQYGTSRIFGALADNPEVPVGIFRTTEEAVSWLQQADAENS